MPDRVVAFRLGEAPVTTLRHLTPDAAADHVVALLATKGVQWVTCWPSAEAWQQREVTP